MDEILSTRLPNHLLLFNSVEAYRKKEKYKKEQALIEVKIDEILSREIKRLIPKIVETPIQSSPTVNQYCKELTDEVLKNFWEELFKKPTSFKVWVEANIPA